MKINRAFLRPEGELLSALGELSGRVRTEVDDLTSEVRGQRPEDRFKTTPYHGGRLKDRSAEYQRAKAKRRLKRRAPAEMAEMYRARPGEILLKDFVASEAKRCGVHAATIYKRMSMGEYPGVDRREVNERWIFVTVHELPPAVGRRKGFMHIRAADARRMKAAQQKQTPR